MKIKITQAGETVLELQDPVFVSDVIQKLESKIPQTSLLHVFETWDHVFPDLDLKTAITSSVFACFQYVTKCVMNGRFSQLDWIFQKKLVSPDFIAVNGSPLILFAMQHSVEMFRYFVSHGARIIIDGDVVYNKKSPNITATFAAGANNDIKRVLLNFVIVNNTRITNIDTLREYERLAKSFGLSKNNVSKLSDRIYNLAQQISAEKALVDKKQTEQAQAALALAETPKKDVLLSLVTTQCTETNKLLQAGRDLPESDILSAMYTALAQSSLDTYHSICRAFPAIKIQ